MGSMFRMSQVAKVSISVVSHGQGRLIAQLLDDLQKYCGTPLEVILTLNVPEPLPEGAARCRFPLQVIRNDRPKGFAANHNAAFRQARADYFCVLNPDVRLRQDPFPQLIGQLGEPRNGLAAPRVVNPEGHVEDSARSFPTPLKILRRALSGRASPEYPRSENVVSPDWVAGMFMLLRSTVYRAINGFDERYFLYYEDVDLCWRLRRSGYRVVLLPVVQVVHAAQRASHREFRYFRWHLSSMLRFFWTRMLLQKTD